MSMEEVIEATESAFRIFSQGGTHTPQRTSIKIGDDSQILVMPCLLQPEEQSSVIGLKFYTEFSQNSERGLPISHAATLLVDASNGRPSGFMEGMYLTGLRTGATSAVAAKHLLPNNPNSLGVIGAGFQSYFQVWAISRIKEFQDIGVYDVSTAKMAKWSDRIEEDLGFDVTIHNSSKSLVSSSDVVVTATSSTEPVFEGRALRSGSTVFAIGSYNPNSRELDTEVMKKSDIYVDEREAALAEAGDLLIPMQEGKITKGEIQGDLGQLVSGEVNGRTKPGEICVFKAVGLAFEDLAVAQLAYRKAHSEGVGNNIDVFQFKQ